MVSRILVPMDDSEFAERALKYALDNFPNAEISVLHVVGVPSPMMGEASALMLEDDLEEAAANRAEPVFERARELAAEHDRSVDTIVGLGHPARNILDRAADFDTIVIGSHGEDWHNAPRQYLIGNIAETVSKRAPIPVIIVR